MRVQGPASTRTGGPAAVRRDRGSTFRVGHGAGPDVLEAAGGVGIAAVGALLALQDLDAAEGATAHAAAHGRDLLDRLRRLQADLLDGRFDRKALQDLAASAACGVPAGVAAGLADVVRDIEVRAAVELAKLDVELPAPPTAPAMPQSTTPALVASRLRAYRGPSAG